MAVSGGGTALPEPATGIVGAYSEVHLVRSTTTVGDGGALT